MDPGTLLGNAIGGIAVPVFEAMWKVGGYATNQIKDAKQRTAAIEAVLKASSQYAETYRERHGQMKIMPGLMKDPVPLDSIYTAVKFLDEQSIRTFETQDDLEEAYRNSGRRCFQSDGERHDGMSVAQEKQYLMVLGGPGVGKSTFLRKLGLTLKGQDGQLQSQQIPVFIELKTFRRSDIDLKSIITQEFEICGFPEADAFAASTLDEGKLLILLDGLDEVPTDNLNPVIEHIENFVTQYSNNTFVASCRTAAYHSSFQRFTDVTIADFDDEQIEQFIRRWFNAKLDREAETADRCWELLQQPENAAAKELAQTPLLLTFLCLVYDQTQNLPSTRSNLYGKALDILLDEWSAQKRLERDPIYEGFNSTLEKILLSDIAYKSFEEDRLFFSKAGITNHITTFLADRLGTPEHLDGGVVLKAIEKQQGILVERATNTYSFSHLTLQEYLAALYVVKKEQRVDDLVSQHLTDERWREVFLLAAGLMEEGVDRLLATIDQQARTYINQQPKIQNLLQWADRVTQGSVFEYEGFGKRAMSLVMASASASARAIVRARASASASASARAIVRARASNIVRARASDIASASAIDRAIDIDIAIARASAIDIAIASAIDRASDIASASDIVSDGVNQLIELQIFNIQSLTDLPRQLQSLRENIPQPSAPDDYWSRYADQLEDTWLSAFELNREAVSLSEEEWQAFGDYLYANELLLRCQRSSIGLSRAAWEALEARLLKL